MLLASIGHDGWPGFCTFGFPVVPLSSTVLGSLFHAATHLFPTVPHFLVISLWLYDKRTPNTLEGHSVSILVTREFACEVVQGSQHLHLHRHHHHHLLRLGTMCLRLYQSGHALL